MNVCVGAARGAVGRSCAGDDHGAGTIIAQPSCWQVVQTCWCTSPAAVGALVTMDPRQRSARQPYALGGGPDACAEVTAFISNDPTGTWRITECRS